VPLLEELQALQVRAKALLAKVQTAGDLEVWRIRFLGAKGALKAAMRGLSEVPADQKPQAGKALNDLKHSLQEAYDARAGALAGGVIVHVGTLHLGIGLHPPSVVIPNPTVDVTLPGRRPKLGHLHVITQTINEICDIFGRMGFEVVYGREVEDEWHNFTALNMPAWHPARDPLDNFYIDDDTFLRPQTSTVQIRVMESRQPPVRIIAPGRVYRPDTVDATHYFMFHQVEGLYVDEGVTMADLKTCVDQFCKAYFGGDVATRFRPHFFPFTEPSAEVDVSCPACQGAKGGCSICKGSGWMELAGSGMVHPNVLESVGYDSKKYTGFAFGFGIDRMVMRKHRIPDIRLLFENDARFLRQF